MSLTVPSLCLAALLAADAPPLAPCGGTPFSAALPETPRPPPLPPSPPPDDGLAWCPPDFEPSPPRDDAPVVVLPPGERTWMDQTHAFIESRLFAPVLRLDRFFSDEKALEDERARSFLQWRTELRFDAEAKPALGTGVRASLRLPGLHHALRRVRLVVEGQTREAVGAMFPDDREAQDGRPVGRTGDAELRFALFEALRARADLGAGVLFTWPPGVFTRARLKWRYVPFDHLVSRAALSGFWRTDTRFGTMLDMLLERPFPARRPMLARLGSELLLTEVSRGVEWTPDLTFLAALGPRAAAAIGAAAYWTSDPDPGRPRLDRYKVGVRLRRAFYRRWLFFELEPEFYWPWTPTERRHAAWATTLRIDVQFHGIERPRPAPATPELDEPILEEDEPDVGSSGAGDVAGPAAGG